MTTSAIDDRVDALAIRCLGVTTPCASCVHQSSDGGRTKDVLQSRVVVSQKHINVRRWVSYVVNYFYCRIRLHVYTRPAMC